MWDTTMKIYKGKELIYHVSHKGRTAAEIEISAFKSGGNYGRRATVESVSNHGATYIDDLRKILTNHQ